MNAKATYSAEEVHANKSYSKKIEPPPPPPELDADAFERDLMNALMDDPESEQFLEQFTKDLAFNDEDLGASSLNAAKKWPTTFKTNSIYKQKISTSRMKPHYESNS